MSYRDEKFEQIRKLDKITHQDLVSSFSIELNGEKQFKTIGNDATFNQSFFFRSADKRFLIKSITNNEKYKLFSMLDSLI